MGIGDILESAGSSFDPGIGASPYIPKVAAGLAGALSGFSAGRAARRKLGAADRIRRLEDKLGFPIDALSRMSPAVQSEVMQRAGFGADSGNEPLSQYEGLSINDLMKRGAPAGTANPPEGTGVFAGVPGGPQQDLSREELPRQLPAMPPLSLIPKSQAAGALSSRFGGGATVDPYKEAQTRAANLLGDVRQGQLEQQPAEADLTQSRIKATDALTASRESARRLAQQAAADLTVPDWLVKQLRLGGIRIPEGQAVTHKTLDSAMKGAGGFQEYQRLVDEFTPALMDRARADPKFSRKDVQKFAQERLAGRLEAASLQFSSQRDLAKELFVERVWASIQHQRQTINSGPPETPGSPYSLPGYPEGQ